MISTKQIQPIESSPSASMMDDADLFCRLVQSGIERWIEAGKLLCRAKESNPAVLITIRDRAPYLTNDILQSFLRMGEKKLYPYLLLDASPASQKISLLPYDRQVELYGKPVTVAYRNADGSFQSYETAPQNLTKQEAELVFSKAGLRSMEEQHLVLRNGKPVKQKGRKHVEEPSDAQPIVESIEDTVKRLLLEMTAKLLEMRESLEQLGKPIPDQYAWIDAAMKAIKKLSRDIASK